MSDTRSTKGSIIALLVGTAVLLIGAEAYFRIQYGAFHSTKPNWTEYNEGIGWVLRPGKYSYFDVLTLRAVDISINELGLRNPSISPAVPPGKERVSVVGDSMTFAAVLSDEEMYTGQLRTLAGPRYEIVNVSASGYGTGQELRWLEDLSSRGYEPGTKVILVFFPNDLQDNLGLGYSSLKPNGRSPVFGIAADGNLEQTVPKRKKKSQSSGAVNASLFYHFVRSRLEALVVSYPTLFPMVDALGLTPAIPRTPGIIAGWYSDGWEQRWSVTADILAYFAKQIRSGYPGTEFYIAFIPSPFQVEKTFIDMTSNRQNEDPRYADFLKDIDRPQRMLRQVCEQHEIPFIDTTSDLRQSTFTYFPREGHLNVTGSKIVAKALYDAVFEP